MKKLLLGTSALVAVGLCAGEASAQGYVGLGGFWRNWAMYADYPSNARVNGSVPRDFWMTSNSEIWFKGETKLNNGLIFGFRVELEAWSQTAASGTATHDQIDETWGYVKGSFGEIRFGEEDDVRKLKAYSPYIGGLLGTDSPDAVYALGTGTTYPNLDNDAPKLIYFSPTFGGFSFGVSYAPDQTHGSRSFAGQGKNDCDGTQSRGCNGNDWSVAADYRGKFGDATIGLDGGYSGSQNEIAANKDLSAYRGDAFIQVAGWEVGGNYSKARNANGNNLDTTVYGAGVLYSFAGTPWQVGLIAQRQKKETSATNTQRLTHWVVGAAYNMGGGVQLLGSVNYQKRNNPAGGADTTGTTSVNGASQSATTLVLGIAANF
jgi:outer membrane protein OmpU